MKNLLFICTGNTCRSTMAEGIMKDLLKNTNIKIKSAGTSVLSTGPANNKALEVMREMGIDISNHKSQAITVDMIKNADIILTMTEHHKENVLSLYPQGKEKVFTLKEYASKDKIINDKNHVIDLEDEIDYKKNQYLDEHLEEIHTLIENKKSLLLELEQIEKQLDSHKLKIKEHIRHDVEEKSHLEEKVTLDITDPYGMDMAEYRKTANEIKKDLKIILEKMEK